MNKCTLLDFDGTITTHDTTKYLILELLFLRPWLVISVLYFGLFFFKVRKNGDKLQEVKNRCIGSMLRGLSPEKTEPALLRFSSSIRRMRHSKLTELIKRRSKEGHIILVVSASPDFAVLSVLTGEPVQVIGTRFQIRHGRYTGVVEGIACYGLNKVDFIKNWSSLNFLEVRFVDAWSDAESDLPMMKLAESRHWVCSTAQSSRFRKFDPFGYIEII